MEANSRKRNLAVAVVGTVILVLILVGGTIWMGRSAHRDASDAARSVSMLYLDELAGRRERVVEDNLNDNIKVIRSPWSTRRSSSARRASHAISRSPAAKGWKRSNSATRAGLITICCWSTGRCRIWTAWKPRGRSVPSWATARRSSS